MATPVVQMTSFLLLLCALSVCGGSTAADRAQQIAPIPLLMTPTLVVQPHGAVAPYIRQVGSVAIAGERLTAQSGWKAGDELALEVFPSVIYTVTVEQVNVDMNNTLSLSGKVKGEEFSSFVLAAGDNNVIVRFQDYATAALFTIVRNAADAAGTVTEMDMTKMPAVTDLPARIVEPPNSSPQRR